MHSPNSVTVGTAGGTLLSIVPIVTSSDVAKTVVLAAIGATVSCLVSMFIRCLLRRHKK